jgi:hypothetical protein
MAEVVSWSRGPGSDRGLRALLHVAVGVAVVGGLLALLALARSLSGGTGPVVVGGVALLALGSLGAWRRGLAPTVPLPCGLPRSHGGVDALLDALDPRQLLATVAVAGGALAWVATVDPVLAVGVALGGHLLPALAVGLFSTAGDLDPGEGQLRYGDDDLPLRALSSVRSRRVGDTAFLWCSFGRGSGRTPGLVVVPASVYDDHRTAFEAGLAANYPAEERSDRPLRLVAYGFGGGMLLLGLASGGALYAGGVSAVVGAYVGGSLTLLGAFFLVVGRYET